jgi:hypothetical protein
VARKCNERNIHGLGNCSQDRKYAVAVISSSFTPSCQDLLAVGYKMVPKVLKWIVYGGVQLSPTKSFHFNLHSRCRFTVRHKRPGQ